jgi:hypothetical protein
MRMKVLWVIRKKKLRMWRSRTENEKEQKKSVQIFFFIFKLIPHFLDLKGINKSYSRPKYLRQSNCVRVRRRRVSREHFVFHIMLSENVFILSAFKLKD